MAVRFRIIHSEKVNNQVTQYRADISDSSYSGAVQEKLARDTFFDWEYTLIEPRTVMNEPVQKSSFTINLVLAGLAETDLLSDILDSDEKRFGITFYINGDPQWYGKVLTDLIEYDEGEYKGVGRVVAKDLTILEGADYPVAEVATRTRLIEIIAECLKETGHNLPIRSFTNLTHSNANINQDQDFLYTIYHQKLALQNESGSMSCIEVLENICRAYNLIIRQGAGRWIIEQLPAVAAGTVWQFDYDANGGNPVTTQSPARAVPIDSVNSFILPGSMNKVTGALKSITSSYNHRTKLDPFELPDEVIVTSQFAQPEEFDRELELTTGDTVQLKASAEVTVSDPGSFMTGSAFVRVVAVRSGEPDLYMTGAGGFQTAPVEVAIPVSGGSAVLTGSLNLTATIGTITKKFTGLKIIFLFGEASQVSPSESRTVTQVKFIDTELIAGEPERDFRAGSTFTYTRPGSYSVTEEIRPTVLGDGPQPFSKGIPAYSNTTASDMNAGFFRIRGVDEFVNLQEITLRERMNMRRKPMRMLQANLWMRFSPANLVNYDGVSWFFLGGHWEANGSQWSSSLVAFDYLAGVGDEFDEFDPDGSGGGSIPGGGRFGGTQFLGVTTSDYNGQVLTEIDVDLNTSLFGGFEYWIINDSEVSETDPRSGVYPFRPTVSGQTGIGEMTISVSQTIPITAPSGSYIILSPSGVNTGIIRAMNAITLFAESSSIGQVLTGVDGIVDELDVNLFGYLDSGDIVDFIVEDSDQIIRVQVQPPSENETRYDSGRQMLKIRSRSLTIPEDTYFKLNGVSLSSRFYVDPGKIKGVVDREKTDDSIGTISDVRNAGTSYTTIALKDIEEAIEVETGQVLKIINNQREAETVTVATGKTLSVGTDTIAINSKVFTFSYEPEYAWMYEPGYKLTGRLTIEAGKVSLNATNITSQGSQIAGLDLDVTQQGTSIATLFTNVQQNAGDITAESDARIALTSRVTTNEDGISANAQAILSADSSIGNLQTDTNHVFRQATFPTTRPSEGALRSGDVLVKTNENNRTYSYDGRTPYAQAGWIKNDGLIDNNASATIQLNTDIETVDGKVTTINATAVMKAEVNASGEATKLAFVRVDANAATGSAVKLKGDSIILDGDTTVIGDFLQIRRLIGGNLTTKAGMSAEGNLNTSVRIWAGGTSKETAPFKVFDNGRVRATGGSNLFEGDITAHSFTAKLPNGNTTLTMGPRGLLATFDGDQYSEQIYRNVTLGAGNASLVKSYLNRPYRVFSFHVKMMGRQPNGGGGFANSYTLVVRTGTGGVFEGQDVQHTTLAKTGWSGSLGPHVDAVQVSGGFWLRLRNPTSHTVVISAYIHELSAGDTS